VYNVFDLKDVDVELLIPISEVVDQGTALAASA
jgi:hypothetical protein